MGYQGGCDVGPKEGVESIGLEQMCGWIKFIIPYKMEFGSGLGLPIVSNHKTLCQVYEPFGPQGQCRNTASTMAKWRDGEVQFGIKCQFVSDSRSWFAQPSHQVQKLLDLRLQRRGQLGTEQYLVTRIFTHKIDPPQGEGRWGCRRFEHTTSSGETGHSHL